MNTVPCERCGVSSWDGSDPNPRCPFCRKFKQRGSREEMAKQIHDLREVCLNAVGFLGGVSILTKESLEARLVEILKDTE